jgi:hypothetical protein
MMAYASAWRSTEAEKALARGHNRAGSRGHGPGFGNHPERKATDQPEWWTMAMSELRDQAMSLAQSSDQKNKTAAKRVSEIVAIRERGQA